MAFTNGIRKRHGPYYTHVDFLQEKIAQSFGLRSLYNN